MTEQLNLTKYLKGAFRRRPMSEAHMSFKRWMRDTARHLTAAVYFTPNAADAAGAWCRRKGVKT